MSTLRIGSRFLAAAAVLLILAGITASVAFAAEGERVLDPTLSLVGGCVAETLDPVEDPGCPGGQHPPAGVFAAPYAVGTDLHGDIYVASKGKKADGSEGRIDIFNPDGFFLSEVAVTAPQSLAIDSEGVLYVWSTEPGRLLRFEPCGTYNPGAGQIAYCQPPTIVPLVGPECSEHHENYLCSRGGGSDERSGLALNHANDHVFLIFGNQVVEYSSAVDGNEEVSVTELKFEGLFTGYATGIALDVNRHRLYAQEGGNRIGFFELTEGTPPQEEYARIGSVTGEESGVPGGNFGGYPTLAVDEGTGALFVYDTANSHLWELDEEGHYLTTVDFPFQAGSGASGASIAVDNGLASPNGKLSEEEEKGRYLYVPSNPKGTGHSFAFFVSIVGPPEVVSSSAGNFGEDEAGLHAQINPHNLQTSYTFQVKVEGAADWTTVGGGTIAASNLDAAVSVAATGLSPGTHYLYRVTATNEEGSDEGEGSFATYPSLPVEPSICANALLRTGFSALLPDCRAYELVTPPDTNARAPLGEESGGGGYTTRQVSPAGDKVPFRVEGGSLPGLGGVGGLKGDPYLATRTTAGWTTASAGPQGSEATGIVPGTTSPDQGYSFWEGQGEGSAVIGPRFTTYVRYPDGHSELAGQGSLGTDPEVLGRLITEGGEHIVFETGAVARESAVQLEPEAAPDKTPAIYDRTPEGTKVVSLKPGDLSFAAGERAVFQGASFDGMGIAFRIESSNVLYLRYRNEKTFEIGKAVEFAGVAEGGARIFYLENGNLEAFDVASGKVIEFANTTAAVVPVTVSPDGSTAYFVSKNVISGSGVNPVGAKPKVGGQNLYRSREGQIAFVGTVAEGDVQDAEGKPEDLGLWEVAINSGRLGIVPARSTPDGGVFLFKSRAALTGYNPEGHSEIYRYDSVSNVLECLSCNPTGSSAQSDADLQSENREGSKMFTGISWPENLRADGSRAFFQSSEPLVARDTDGLQDVYEWEEQGVGSCTQPGGCVFLISSPQSRRNEYLWAVSRSGDDVFFLSSDLLVGSDADETPSIYDAKVEGGFAEPAQAECEGEGCRPALASPPLLPTGETPVRGAGDNVKPHVCGKGKHKVKRGGKVRCVKKRHHRHRRAGTGQKGGSR